MRSRSGRWSFVSPNGCGIHPPHFQGTDLPCGREPLVTTRSLPTDTQAMGAQMPALVVGHVPSNVLSFKFNIFDGQPKVSMLGLHIDPKPSEGRVIATTDKVIVDKMGRLSSRCSIARSWPKCRAEFGGDDFGGFFEPQEGVCARLLHSEGELDVSATATHPPLAGGSSHAQRQLIAHPCPRSGGFFFPGNGDSHECRLPLACAPSWRHASGHVPLKSVSDMPRQPRSSRLRCGSDRVGHTSSPRHPCANGHRFSMVMPPSCSINPRGGFTPSPPRVGCVSASLFPGDSP